MSLKAKFYVALWIAAVAALAFNGFFAAVLMLVVATVLYAGMYTVLSVVPC